MHMQLLRRHFRLCDTGYMLHPYTRLIETTLPSLSWSFNPAPFTSITIRRRAHCSGARVLWSSKDYMHTITDIHTLRNIESMRQIVLAKYLPHKLTHYVLT